MGKRMNFLLVVLLLHVVYSNQQCNQDCNEKLMTDAILSQARFPSSFFLETHCGIFNETVSCLVKDAEECAGSLNRKVLNEYKTIQLVVDNICQAGSSFRQAYLRSLSCYNNQMENYRNCSTTVKQVVDGLKASGIDATEPVELRSPYKYQCLTLPLELNCMIRETAENCGVEAAAPLRDILHSMTNLLVKTLCSDVEMAVWSDEFLKYLMVKREAVAATSQVECQTLSNGNEGRPASRPEEIIPPGTTQSTGSHMKDVVRGVITATRQRMSRRSNQVNEEGN